MSFGSLRTRTAIVFLSMVGVILVGFINNWTGYEISVSVLYLVPVLAAAWYAGWWSALAVSMLAGGVWYGVELYSGQVSSNVFVPVWNSFMRVGFFVINAYLAAQLHVHLERERRLARQDPLTGLMNGRAFLEGAERYFALFRRKTQPVTMVYIDLDNFKAVNDTLSHSEGDRVLCAVADALMRGTRHYDLTARLGGDEFGVMLPETDHMAADGYITKTLLMLEAEMARNGWAVSFSIGVATFQVLPKTVGEALGIADGLMYKVKHSGKCGVLHEVWASKRGTEALVRTLVKSEREGNVAVGTMTA